MDIINISTFIDLGTQALTAFKEHIILLLALLAIAFVLGALWRRSLDDGEIRGLRAQKEAADDRLHLAHDQNERVAKQIGDLEAKVEQQDTVIAALTDELTRTRKEKDNITQDRIFALNRSNTEIKNAVLNLSNSAADLGTTLTIVGSRGKIIIDPSR